MSLEHREKVSETKPAVWGDLPTWGWGMIAVGEGGAGDGWAAVSLG
jgi:hypothetical protein